MALIYNAGFEIVEQPPYPPDLAYSDLSYTFRRTHFLDNDRGEPNQWFATQHKIFFS